MKKFIVVIGMLFLIVSCGSDNGDSKTNNKAIDASKLIERNGIIYEINQEKPYTGITIQLNKHGKKYQNSRSKGTQSKKYKLRASTREIYSDNRVIWVWKIYFSI